MTSLLEAPSACRFLISEVSVAHPGFSRWLVPPAATLHSSGHRPRSTLSAFSRIRSLRAERRRRRGLEFERGGLYLFHRHRGAPGFPRLCVWPMAGDGGTSQGDVCRGYLFRVWISGGGCRRGDPILFCRSSTSGMESSVASGWGLGYISPVSTLSPGSVGFPTGRDWLPASRSWASVEAR